MNNTHTTSELYNRLLRIGVTKELSFSEKLRTELCNQFIVISLPVVALHLFYNFLTVNLLREYLLAIMWGVILSMTLVLNHFHKYFWAKIYTLVVPVLVIAVIHMLFGWIQRLDFMYLLFILVSCYILERRQATLMISMILLIYVGVAVFLYYFEPPYVDYVIPSGSFAYFAFAVLITISLTAKVLRENRRYNQITIEQNKMLEAQNKELERFTYIASHDLKSPLSNIMGFSDIIEEDLREGDYDTALEHLSFIQTSSKRMSYLIEDILELSKVKNGSKENRKEVNLNEIAKTIQRTFNREIKRKGVTINCQKLPFYHCNETEFSLLFQNLIQNGIKYNENPMPKINIWSVETEDTLSLYFKDNGIGIEPEKHETIFEYFKRLHTQTEYEGTGIGLGLCKKIVQNYNGKISVESEPNQGSTFVVELPRNKVF